MKALVWLVGRELRGRPVQVAVSVVAMALLAALLGGVELAARGRADAVASRMMGLGPALILAPPGVSGRDLARHTMGQAALSERDERQVLAALADKARGIEARRLLLVESQGRVMRMVGLRASKGTVSLSVPAGQVVLGSLVAQQSGWTVGQKIEIEGRSWLVARVRPALGDADDAVIFARLNDLAAIDAGTSRPNALLIYPALGVDGSELRDIVQQRSLGLASLVPPREAQAEQSVSLGLGRSRWALVVIVSMLFVLASALWTHFNLRERRHELRTLHAVGLSAVHVLAVVQLRSVVLSILASGLGLLLALAVLAGQSSAVESTVSTVLAVVPWLLLVVVATGLLGSLPPTLWSLRQVVSTD